MSYCLNLHCQQPQNPKDVEFCQTCGSKLLLRGHYQVIKPIGNGSFGRTFLAVDLDRFNTPCVVKQFFPQNHNLMSTKKGSELFKREAEQLLKLGDNPQIPTLYAYFEEPENLYLVEQFIAGKTILQELEEQGAFSENKIWEILLELLPLLKFIHEEKVIHRDIKPENILRFNTSRPPEKGKHKLVLIDFGVAKLNSQDFASEIGTMTGTLGYAPIEQIRGGKAYPASDLYSLGITCLHLLTQKAPNQLFDPFTGELIWRSHLLQQGREISDRLEKVLDKLVKDLVKERYQSATELLTEISQTSTPNIKQTTQINQVEKKSLEEIQTPQEDPEKVPHISIIVQAEVEAWKNRQNVAESNEYKREKIFHNNINSHYQNTQQLSENRHFNYQSKPLNNVIEFEKKKTKLSSTKTKIRNYLKLSQLWKSVQIIQEHNVSINTVAISPHGFTLVTGSDDKIIRLWNLKTGQLLHKFLGHTAEVYAIAITADGRRIFSGGDDRTILAWNLQKKTIADRFYSHSGSPYSHGGGAILSVAISPDNETVISGSADHTIKLWNQRNGELLCKLHEHLDKVFCVTYAKINHTGTAKNYPQNQIFASSSADSSIKIWQTGSCVSLKTLRGHSGGVYSVAFTSDAQAIASGGADRTIKLWDVRTGELLNIFKGHSRAVLSVAISPDSQILASGSLDGTVKLWNLHTGKLLDSLCGYHPVQFTPDGKTLVSGGEGGRILIWKL
ncbi:MAG: serine/threonine-protein kinase [Cyanobacteriota bacterium]|nr:serine/threonine-protein kinase [Cyanobacteriota bacterium]